MWAVWLVACVLHHGPIASCDADGVAAFVWVAPADVRGGLIAQVRWPGESWQPADYRDDGDVIEVRCDPGQDARISFYGDDTP
jgi:hypothetical protein